MFGIIQHAYDLVGNRTDRTTNGFAAAESFESRTFSYNENDRITGDIYDANGNTITATNTSSTDYYDAENRLIRRESLTHTNVIIYDHEGNRVRKTGNGATTYYLSDDRNLTGYIQVLAEYSNTSSSPDRTYTYGHDLISQDLGSQLCFYGYDGHGSVRVLVGDTTSAVEKNWYDYDAYGKLLAYSEEVPNHYRYTGEQWDADLVMYFLRARYYRPETGRFWTMDSYEGSSSEPLSLHKYLYCHANPVNGTAPSGEETLIGISLAGTIGGGLDSFYNSAVEVTGNSLKNTIIGVYSGASVGQIVALNFLDNAGGAIAGKFIGKLAQLRKLPGVVKGVGKAIRGNRWLRGSNGNAGPIPEQIARKLAGRKFANFDEFRSAFWKEVAEDADLAKGFSAKNVAKMKNGNAPHVHSTQAIGERAVYELHHSQPIQHGGDVYDLDNLIVVTPRYHKEVLDPIYHY